ncbi:hypothetical protein H6P81_006477 [Aristolochia fimbriata]|uniref:Uncharacterized protein n=1 Tax=Aristolochia fimbriata TaxID=158543 RepID=A0AAV7F1Y5_ARIFI|nr:hypothetical protein H6P81_006477 [Aristolochia fimbriata]
MFIESPLENYKCNSSTFEALTQFGTATITTRNIGTLEASYKDNAILKDSNFNKIDRATCQFVTTAIVLVNGTEGDEAGSMKKDRKEIQSHQTPPPPPSATIIIIIVITGHRNHQDSKETLGDAWEGYSTNKEYRSSRNLINVKPKRVVGKGTPKAPERPKKWKTNFAAETWSAPYLEKEFPSPNDGSGCRHAKPILGACLICVRGD